jgi:hypothetical protein
MSKNDSREAMGAECPVIVPAAHAQNRGLAWVTAAFLICPCHTCRSR